MINGQHTLLPVAIVIMPDGTQRIQILNGNATKFTQIMVTKEMAASVREHLTLSVLATEPCYQGTEEPLRGFP